ncbi:hypothetical protein TI39_contig501g00001 [Zymoseptoria brevis]|uniref:Uncharacterized protein n=1 Tax=Zymoseptoria brevis TaxID=1047168 RepID=A0A0F4GJ07_9PEZI|nr:hypothetical protein TI39_contig501g00001 [Zymoseptoria brevis]
MSPTSTPSMDSTTPCHGTRTLTSLPTASRDLILQISTDLTRRMNRLLASNRIAAVDVIPIAKDILDLSTLRCLVAEKRSQRLRRSRQNPTPRRGRDRTNRSSPITTFPSPSSTSEAPTWEEMDNHVCAKSRQATRISNPVRGSLPQNPVKPSRSWTNLISRRRAQNAGEEEEEVDCHCTRALDLMDLEGDILRSFPDDSGDTLVAPELASWAIGHLRVEAEWTRGMVEELLGEDDDDDDDEYPSPRPSIGSPRVDSMEPEGGSPLVKQRTTSGKSIKASSGTRRVRGWWKSDVDDEGEVEVEDLMAKAGDVATDRERGQMVNIRFPQRKRERVFAGLRRRFSSS